MPILRKISLKHLLMCKSILVHLAWFIQSLSHLLRVAKYTYWVAFLFVDSYVCDIFDKSRPLKVNQKWPFSGSGLQIWEIKCHFWVRIWDFQTSILFPVCFRSFFGRIEKSKKIFLLTSKRLPVTYQDGLISESFLLWLKST